MTPAGQNGTAPHAASPPTSGSVAAGAMIDEPGSRAATGMSWVAMMVWIFAIWTVAAVPFTIQRHYIMNATGRPESWGFTFAFQLCGWWAWAVLTPVVFALSRDARRMGGGGARAMVIAHTLGGVSLAILSAALEGAAKWAFGLQRPPSGLESTVYLHLVNYVTFDVMVYAMIAGLYYAFTFYREAQVKSTNAARLETALVQARLDMLAAQIQPHFLFNTLHAISALVLDDPQRANQMITRLSVLLRRAFQSSPSAPSSLADELELLDHYVAIQEIRFGERLRVMFHIDPSTTRARVPPLLLQPLVENAIRYGTATRADVTTVDIVARRENGRLHLEVRDNGPGLSSSATDGAAGLGVANTRARLSQLYGAQQTFTLVDASEGGGAIAIVEIPFEQSSMTNPGGADEPD